MRKLLLLALLTVGLQAAKAESSASTPTKYALLLPAAYENGGTNSGLSNSEKNAADWFYTEYVSDETGEKDVTGYSMGKILQPSDLTTSGVLNPSVTKVVWVHYDSAVPSLTDEQVAALKAYALAGGNLYLTIHATQLVTTLGRVPANWGPNLTGYHPAGGTKGIKPNIGNQFNHQYHPIFDGLSLTDNNYFQLVTTDYAKHDYMWNLHGAPFTGTMGWVEAESDWTLVLRYQAMTNSLILGTWEHVSAYDCMGMIEYLPVPYTNDNSLSWGGSSFNGRIVANGLGGYDWASDSKTTVGGETNIAKLTANTLEYLSTAKTKKVAYLLPNNIADGFDKATALASVDPDDEYTALDWFYTEYVEKGTGTVIRPKDVADLDPTEITTVWVHIDRDQAIGADINNNGCLGAKAAELPSQLDYDNIYKELATYVKNGGNMLLTKQAVQMVGPPDGGSNKYIGRAHLGVTMHNYGGGKTDADPWAINPVVGAGFITVEPDGEGNDGKNYTGKNGKNYVSYYWTSDGQNITQSRSADDIFDHQGNVLYYGLTWNDTAYPILQNEGFGRTKYRVCYIEAGNESFYKEDHNDLWVFQRSEIASFDGHDFDQDHDTYALTFMKNNKCDILGQWGHKSQLDNAAFVQFNSANVGEIGSSQSSYTSTWNGEWYNDAWEGRILCLGLGAYEWQPSNTDGSRGSGENYFIREIKQLTINALNALESDIQDGESKSLTIGGVTYFCTKSSDGNVLTALPVAAESDLQAYSITETQQGSSNDAPYVGNGNVYDGTDTYAITGFGSNLFTNCNHLAFADLQGLHDVTISRNIRSSFPAHTLIYVPQETATSIADCRVKGENIVNQLSNGNRVCEHLKVYDLVPGSDPNDYDFTWFANKYAFTAYQVSYDREFPTNTEDYMATIALPFSITAEEAAQLGEFYWYKGMTADNTLRFFNANGVAAHHPYLFVPTYQEGGVPVSISISNVEKTIPQLDAAPAFNSETQKYSLTTPLTVTPGGDMSPDAGCGAFYASFRPQVVGDWSDTPEEENTARYLGYYCFSDGEFKAWDYIFLDPYRCYLLAPGKHIWEETEGGAKGLGIKLEYIDYTPEPQTNGISNLSIPSRDNSYYTLSGVRVEKPTRGIYIRNNKKTIVK